MVLSIISFPLEYGVISTRCVNFWKNIEIYHESSHKRFSLGVYVWAVNDFNAPTKAKNTLRASSETDSTIVFCILSDQLERRQKD